MCIVHKVMRSSRPFALLLCFVIFVHDVLYQKAFFCLSYFCAMLYVVPTPIWNKDDITLRALQLLKDVDIMVCEDTRTTKKLLWMYDIVYSKKEFLSLTSYTSPSRLSHILGLCKDYDVLLVSDAGTPWFSDPGKTFLFACQEADIAFTVLPWANALIPAIVSAGFPTQNFVFLGFLPTKKGRQTSITSIVQSSQPVFFYESVHRIQKTIQQLVDAWCVWRVSIAREVSKMFEQCLTLPISDMLEQLQSWKIVQKWEFVVWVRNW